MKTWKNIKKTVGDVRRCPHFWRVYADSDSGTVWCNEYASENEWTVYHNPQILNVASGYGYRSIFGPTKLTMAGLREVLDLMS